MRWIVGAICVSLLAACGTDEGSGSSPDGSDDYSSICDEFDNRVYLSEDDIQSSPAIFVLQNDCEG